MLGTSSIFELSEGTNSAQDRAVLATRALQVRKVGTDLISLAGGQFIDPVKAVVGGVTDGVAPRPAAEMRQQIAEALPVACELFDAYWETSFALRDRIGTGGDDAPAYYITATSDTRPNYDGHPGHDVIRVLSPEGVVCDAFPARGFRDYLTFEETDYSYAGRTSYRGEVMRANSLARINMTRCLGTARADGYLSRFRETFGQPAHAILLFDLGRGIELVYALERALEILEEPLDDGETAVPHTPRDGRVTGWWRRRAVP